MKKIIYIALLCSFLVSLPTGCARLDLDPYNYASENTSFKNKRDAEMWVNGMYNALRDYNQGQQMYASDLQADYLNAAAGAMEKLPSVVYVCFFGARYCLYMERTLPYHSRYKHRY